MNLLPSPSPSLESTPDRNPEFAHSLSLETFSIPKSTLSAILVPPLSSVLEESTSLTPTLVYKRKS
ncbi:hypothetical protein L195_g021624 [Trifolium pratense]|uniref:Uncharacterized protein n=1 Tax=Trifolium pratense TaxID=57577 RepID=A0A2K3MCF5_TRIPR|nr:hypothetical protein L195_g049855 [Trifolium pratense]PNX88460.1 hypothetical protein L195_g044565 [Trifolium pratense]PNX98380.1 hypothetical protein L195_g021624 [Trifolium pratense]